MHTWYKTIAAIAAMIILCCAPLAMQGQTEITEDVTTNTTWDAAGSPYQIMSPSGRILIPKGITLTLEAGTVVHFPGEQSILDCKGTINANGAPGNPVTFTRDPGYDGLWYSIQFNGIEGEGVGTLNHCVIEYAGAPRSGEDEFDAGVNCIFGAMPTIDNCTIRNCKNGVYFDKESNATVQNCTITDNEKYGLYIHNSSPIITANTVSNNALGGVYQQTEGAAAAYPQYDGNTFAQGQRIVLDGTLAMSGLWEYAATPYFIDQETQIEPGVTLTIEPNVVIQFLNTNSSLAVRGYLVAEGTDTEPILMTTAPESSTRWFGVNYVSKNTDASRMKHVIIENAGYKKDENAIYGAVFCSNEAAPSFDNIEIRNCLRGFTCFQGAAPEIKNSTVKDCDDYGMWFVDASPTVTGNTITGNGVGGILQQTRADGETYPQYEGNSFGPDNLIHIVGNADKSGTIEYAAVPYLIAHDWIIQQPETLEVEPGVEFHFDNEDAGLRVYGTLEAAGTMSDPITFTRAAGMSGNWSRILFVDANTNSSFMDYCVVEFGGKALSDESILGAVECRDGAMPALNNCTVRNSQNGVLSIETEGPVMDNCTLENNNRFGLMVVNASPTLQNSRIQGNGEGGVQINTNGLEEAYPKYDGNTFSSDNRVHVTGNLTRSGTWEFANTPYFIDEYLRIDPGVELTIEPGVEIQFGEFTAGLNFQRSKLTAIGTPQNPIKFTKSPDVTNPWQNIFFRGEGDSASTMENVIFELGGWSPLGGQAMLICEDGANPYIRKCIITESADQGILAKSGSEPFIWSSMLFDNANRAIYNNNAPAEDHIIYARYNWWGDPSGPYDKNDRSNDPTGLHNPDGLGDEVSDFVDYRDWLTVATNVEPVSSVPGEFALLQNFPNPMQTETTIAYKLERPTAVTLRIYNAAGEQIYIAESGYRRSGTHTFPWNGVTLSGNSVPNGVYYYTLSNGTAQVTKKLIVER
ncbi:MAG: hypothetical protein CL946_13515 [Ectothiorhodospiraceae bacterium]|nr:hypothetical protein [Ectothiorhodospiraceae bacterium]